MSEKAKEEAAFWGCCDAAEKMDFVNLEQRMMLYASIVSSMLSISVGA